MKLSANAATATAIAVAVSQLPSGLRHDHDQAQTPTWREKYGLQYDHAFSGPLSFSHLPYTKCLEQEETSFDIAILGIPFDTSVYYRPGCV